MRLFSKKRAPKTPPPATDRVMRLPRNGLSSPPVPERYHPKPCGDVQPKPCPRDGR